VAHVVELQKAQQGKRPVYPIWEKAQEYCDKRSMLPEETLLLERGWIIEETVMTYVECGRYEGKRVQTYKN